MRRPNILFITLDQWRGDCLGSAGHPVVETPNLDRLASEGVRFTSHYAQTAPCGPSRASLLTGTYQHVHRSVQNGTPLDARFTNVALEARAAGYDPVLFGHTDTTVDPRTVPDDDPRLEDYEGPLPGFRVALDLPEDREAWYRWLKDRGHDVSDRDRFLRPRTDMAVPPGRGASWAPPPFAADETETAFLVGEVVGELEGLIAGGRPWFVHASIYRPHPPFVVPEPYNDLVDPASVPEPLADESGDVHPFLAAARSWRHTRPPSEPLDLRQLRATYYGMMSEVDDQVGRLLAALEWTGAADDTIVVVTGDHGEGLMEHGHALHGLDIYQEVSSVDDFIGGGASPDIILNTREFRTSLLADNGEIIVLGGLIEQTDAIVNSKVPFLGDIPVAGNLFKSEGRSNTRTNLMIFIKPTIVRDRGSANAVTARNYNYIRAQELLRGEQAGVSIDTFLDEVLGPVADPE